MKYNFYDYAPISNLNYLHVFSSPKLGINYPISSSQYTSLETFAEINIFIFHTIKVIFGMTLHVYIVHRFRFGFSHYKIFQINRYICLLTISLLFQHVPICNKGMVNHY